MRSLFRSAEPSIKDQVGLILFLAIYFSAMAILLLPANSVTSVGG